METHDLVEIVPQQEDTYQKIEPEQKSGKKNIGCIVAVIAVAGQTYVLDDGLGSKLNVTINDVGAEDVMEYGTFGDYIEAVYLDCSFKNVGEEEYINTDLFHFYADNQPVKTDISNSMNMVSLSPERETSGLFYAFVNPDEYEYYEKYDMYLYTTSDDLQFCYMPSLQRFDVSSGVYSDKNRENPRRCSLLCNHSQ